MSHDRDQLDIEYYSDVLCVWALIAELKNTELKRHFEDKIQFHARYLDLFSDTESRISEAWQSKGGYEAFGDHVREVASRYLDEKLSNLVWTKVRPTTSASAHLYIKAATLSVGEEGGQQIAHILRRAFFFAGLDISRRATIDEILERENVDRAALEREIDTGRAMAALLRDSRRAQEARVSGSPTWRLNDGRQHLYGNVGYRVLAANVEELLRHPEHEASWC